MRPEDIEEIYVSERVVEKLWSKHAVSEEEAYQVFENEENRVKMRKSEVVPHMPRSDERWPGAI